MGSMKNRIGIYWQTPRIYRVPCTLVKPGKNVITVMVIDVFGAGGLWGGREPEMSLQPIKADAEKIDLSGNWRYFVEPGIKIPALPHNPFRLQNNPGVLFNVMINPLLKFPITGVIWYQGESNAGRAYQYQRLFPALIQDWRIRWQQGDFPFYFVQLAWFPLGCVTRRHPAITRWATIWQGKYFTQFFYDDACEHENLQGKRFFNGSKKSLRLRVKCLL